MFSNTSNKGKQPVGQNQGGPAGSAGAGAVAGEAAGTGAGASAGAGAPTASRYKNSETFAGLVPVGDILEGDLLELDGNAFSISELKAYAVKSPENIYQNPHVDREMEQRGEKKEFSKEAKIKLRAALGEEIVKHLDARLNQDLRQSGVLVGALTRNLRILLDTYLAIGTDPKHNGRFEFDEADLERCDDAKTVFLNFYASLPEEDRARIDQEMISIPNTYGGTSNMLFKNVLDGGYCPCIITEQAYLWYFLHKLDPSVVIPQPIARHHQNRDFDFSASGGSASAAAAGAAAASAFRWGTGAAGEDAGEEGLALDTFLAMAFSLREQVLQRAEPMLNRAAPVFGQGAGATGEWPGGVFYELVVIGQNPEEIFPANPPRERRPGGARPTPGSQEADSVSAIGLGLGTLFLGGIIALVGAFANPRGQGSATRQLTVGAEVRNAIIGGGLTSLLSRFGFIAPQAGAGASQETPPLLHDDNPASQAADLEEFEVVAPLLGRRQAPGSARGSRANIDGMSDSVSPASGSSQGSASGLEDHASPNQSSRL